MKLFKKNSTLSAGEDLPDIQEPQLAFEKFISDVHALKISKKALQKKVALRLSVFVAGSIGVIAIGLFFNHLRSSQKIRRATIVKTTRLISKNQPTRTSTVHSKEPISSPTPPPAEHTPANKISAPAAVKTAAANLVVEKPIKNRRVESSKPSGHSPLVNRTRTPKKSVTSNIPKKISPSSGTPRDTLPDVPAPDQDDFTGQVDRTEFYMPSGTSKKTSGNRQQSSTRSYKGKFSVTSMNAENTPVSQNKIQVITRIAEKFGGSFGSTLEHNGDYYKVKLFIPEASLPQFKKTIAQYVEFASFANLPEESASEKICVILETHAK